MLYVRIIYLFRPPSTLVAVECVMCNIWPVCDGYPYLLNFCYIFKLKFVQNRYIMYLKRKKHKIRVSLSNVCLFALTCHLTRVQCVCVCAT